jgi:hypothetical protein
MKVDPEAADDDGRHDFDFIAGTWRVANRRMDNPLADEAPTWSEFESNVESRPILAGLGNVDTYVVSDFPGRGLFHGFALRLFDPRSRLWRIWWASTASDGQLDTPVMGRFSHGTGQFECDDALGGRAVRVRYSWTDITVGSARWEQAYSFDAGTSFTTNWVMQFRRV